MCVSQKPACPCRQIRGWNNGQSATSHYVTLRFVMLHYIVLCYIALCYVTLRCVTLCVLTYNLKLHSICNIMLRYVTLNLKQWPVGHIVEAFGRTPHHRFTSSVFALVYVTNHNPCWKYYTDTNTETNTLQPTIRL